jgi:O-antigen/teichoic acid export membrane protein
VDFRHHLSKLSWTALDKVLFIVYGFVTLLQIRLLAPEEWGLAAQLVTLQTWIFIICDGSALQSIIQFGVDPADRGRVNYLTLIFLLCIALGISLAVMLFQSPLALLFNEPRFADVAGTLPVFVILTLPRAMGMKLLMRDLRMRDVFLVDLAWFAGMGAITATLMLRGEFNSYEDMKVISLGGVAASSVVALICAKDVMVFRRVGTLKVAQILHFGLPQALMMAVNHSIRQLDVFLVQPFFGTAAAGVYNSTKMLYRLFETVTDAGIALMYPTAVKLLATDRKDQIITVFSKAISLLVIVTIPGVLILEFGGTNLIVQFLGPQYAPVARQFNVMILGAVFLPLFILQSVDLALHKVWKLLGMVLFSSLVGIATFILTGMAHAEELISLGVVTYTVTFAVLLIFSVRADLHFRMSQLFRTVPDAMAALQSRRNRTDAQSDS